MASSQYVQPSTSDENVSNSDSKLMDGILIGISSIVGLLIIIGLAYVYKIIKRKRLNNASFKTKAQMMAKNLSKKDKAKMYKTMRTVKKKMQKTLNNNSIHIKMNTQVINNHPIVKNEEKTIQYKEIINPLKISSSNQSRLFDTSIDMLKMKDNSFTLSQHINHVKNVFNNMSINELNVIQEEKNDDSGVKNSIIMDKSMMMDKGKNSMNDLTKDISEQNISKFKRNNNI
jgi:hypothetical protein